MNKVTLPVYFMLKSQSDLLYQFTQVIDDFLRVLLLNLKRKLGIERFCFHAIGMLYLNSSLCKIKLPVVQFIPAVSSACLLPSLWLHYSLLSNQNRRPSLLRKLFFINTSNSLFICNIHYFLFWDKNAEIERKID